MSGVDAAIQSHVEALIKAETERLEADLARAIMLQDFDRLDHLTVVYQWGKPATVASLVKAAGAPSLAAHRLAARKLLEEYEARHGVITEQEIAALEWIE